MQAGMGDSSDIELPAAQAVSPVGTTPASEAVNFPLIILQQWSYCFRNICGHLGFECSRALSKLLALDYSLLLELCCLYCFNAFVSFIPCEWQCHKVNLCLSCMRQQSAEVGTHVGWHPLCSCKPLPVALPRPGYSCGHPSQILHFSPIMSDGIERAWRMGTKQTLGYSTSRHQYVRYRL